MGYGTKHGPGAKKLPGDIGFQVGGPRCSRFREFWNAISAFVQINVLPSARIRIFSCYGAAQDEKEMGVNDQERLEAFEAFARDVRDELEQTNARMEELRAAGRVKTATYRQLFALRMTLKDIDRRLEEHGL